MVNCLPLRHGNALFQLHVRTTPLLVRGVSGKQRYITSMPIEKFFYAYYGNTAVDLDPLPVSRESLTVVEPALFE